jgi:hypothetical protein
MYSGCSQEKLSDPLASVALHATVSLSPSVESLASWLSISLHNGAFVTAAKSSCSCCNSTSPTRGIDVSVGTSVTSVDTSVESVDASVESVDEATVDEVDELEEVDDATVEVVEVLVDVVVAG